MIKAVIFDFDGTMSNRYANAYNLYDDALRPYFADLSDLEFEAVLQDILLFDCNGTLPVKDRLVPFLKKYNNRFPLGFSKSFTTYWSENMYRYTPLKQQTLEVLEKLKGSYKLALLSNGGSYSQHHKIMHVKIESYFDEIMVSGDYGINKPDKRIFDLLSEKLGVNNEECMMVGDVYSTDIIGAVNAGMLPVWICNNPEIPSKYYKGYRIRDLREVLDILEHEAA